MKQAGSHAKRPLLTNPGHIRRVAIASWLVCAATAMGGDTERWSQPNIVLILADDLAWADPGCFGHAFHRTPNLDRLAKNGVRFTNGYSPAPICSAARASILTGMAVPGLQFEFVTKNQAAAQSLDLAVPLQSPPYTLNLPLSELTLAERLKDLGYATAFFGKWHVSQHFRGRYLAWHPEFGPRSQGFDTAIEDFGDHPYAWKNQRTPTPLPKGAMPQDSMIGRAVDYIGRRHSAPYFLMTSLYHVHTPIRNRCRWLVEEYDKLIPQSSPQRKQRLEYAAFVETLDHHVGRIVHAVDQSKSADNTLIVFWSDNGGHPEYTENAPFRGSKWNLYEGGIRVPVICRWPAVAEAGTVCDTPVIGYDLAATLTDAAGRECPSTDGVSFLPALKKQEMNQRPLVWHFPYYHPEKTFSRAQQSIGINDFAVSRTRPQSAIRKGKFKLLYFAEDHRTELYDLNPDPGEQNDLSDADPQRNAELSQQLQSMLLEMNARHAVRMTR